LNQEEPHLNIEQIECLIETESAEQGSYAQSVLLEKARLHLTVCDACQKLVSMHKEGDQLLRQLRGEFSTGATEHCPPDTVFYQLAGRMMDFEEAERILNHTAQCDHCGPLLKAAIEDLSQEFSTEESKLITNLASSQFSRQQEIAQELAAQSESSGRVVSSRETFESKDKTRFVWFWRSGFASRHRWRWIMIGAATIAIVLGTTFLWYRALADDPERLLAKAYTERRTLELRIPGARYAPLYSERGSTEPMTAEWHEAMAIILSKLAKDPEDADLLDAKGRAQLLQGDYKAAMSTLEHARRIAPDSPKILTDLASAYFQTAEGIGDPRVAYYGKSLEILGEVLAKNPNNRVAWFNRAITDEKIPGNDQQAIEDWEHYLKLEPQGAWAAEARQRLQKLRRAASATSKVTTNNDPRTIAQVLLTRLSTQGRSIDSHEKPNDENYLSLAITQWLPFVSSSAVRSRHHSVESVPEEDALRLTARILDRQHADRWLEDLLKSESSPNFTKGVEALSRAVTANAAGDPARAEIESDLSEKAFRAVGSDAGAIRAQLEGVYALQRSLRANECLLSATALDKTVFEHRYVWMEIQLLLEESACSNMIGNMGAEEPILARALALSRDHGYGTLYLRALGFAGGLERAKGNWNKSWEDDFEGLRIYVAGNYPAIRGYQFFSDLALMAETSGQLYLAAEFWEEGTSILSLTGNKALEAQARFELGSVDSMIGADAEAASEFKQSTELYASLPLTDATRAYLLNGDISLASLEAKRGDYESALARLSAVRSDLSLVSDYEIPLHFYLTLGEIQMHQQNSDAAERSLRAAIAIAEWGLASLHTDSDRLAWERQSGEAYRALVKIKLKNQNDPAGALALWEWYRGASLRSNAPAPKLNLAVLNSNPPVPLVPQIAEMLAGLEETTVLVYAQLPGGVAIWALDNRGVKSEWVSPSPKDLDHLIHTFLEECADNSSSESLLKSHGAQLYRWLMTPLATDFPLSKTLAVELDDTLSQLPFPALVDGTGEYLGSRFVITSYPGFLFARQLRGRTKFTTFDNALVVGAPELSGALSATLPPLPDAGREARAVHGRFLNGELLLSKEATLERLLQELPSADIFHFAGHSFSGPERGGLLLAGSENGTGAGTKTAVMYANHLCSKVLGRCDLAVLSACATVSEDVDAIADSEGLVRAFLRAGVPHVIASRWNVDSRVTADFMDDFYAKLLAGSTVAGAVQSAAADLRSHRETSHPYYWAAFTSFGVS
jgi:CHAT domain-containing protein/tetratricopeptide (TPR) repeat protein